MNLGKRILGAVSAGALVLSMSALSAFAAGNAGPSLTKVTFDNGITVDGAKIKELPKDTDLKLYYKVGNAAAVTSHPGANDMSSVGYTAFDTSKLTLQPDGKLVADLGVGNAVPTDDTEFICVAFGAPDTASQLEIHTIGDGSVPAASNGFFSVQTDNSNFSANYASTINTSFRRKIQNSVVTIYETSKKDKAVSLVNGVLTATATDPLTGKEHKVEGTVIGTAYGAGTVFFTPPNNIVNVPDDYNKSRALRQGLEYTFTLNFDSCTLASGETVTGKDIVFEEKLTVEATPNQMTLDLTLDKSNFVNSAATDPTKLIAPTAGQSYAPISPVAIVESGNPAQSYIDDQIRNNPNFATVVAGTNASNYFTDFAKAKAGAKYSDVYRVTDSSLFASNITPEQYLNLVGNKLTPAGENAISDNTRYVVKVTFPREYINTKYTNDVIVTLVGATGAPNMNTEGLLQNNTVLSNGNKTVSADVDDLVARLNAGNLKTATLLTLNDKNDKPVASFTINASGIVSADNVKQAIDALSTYVTNSNNSVGNSAWNAFVKENPDAKSYPFQFTKDATFKNFTVAVTLNNIPSNVPSGDLYKAVGTKLTKMGSYTASGNKATFTLNGCSNYRLVYGNLDTTVLAAGEGANDSVTEISAESF